jgi:hypothetical protein
MSRHLPAVVVGLLLLALPQRARADKMDTTLDVSLGSRVSWIQVDQGMKTPPFAGDVSVIDATGPRLVGSGVLAGGLLRGGLTLDGVHFGLGAGFAGAGRLSFVHIPPPDHVNMHAGKIWGMPFEAFAGYTFGDSRDIRGFVEVRGGITLLQTQVQLSDERLGGLGAHPLNAYLLALELRAGVRIPLSDEFFVNAGIGGSPIGVERVSGSVALGVPIPLDNL